MGTPAQLAGYELDSTLCSRCGVEKETLYRRIWSCSANCGCPEYDKTAHLQEQARVQHALNPALWLRGLPARSVTTPSFDVDFSE